MPAQKVIDKSQKKRPAWIGAVSDEVLYSSATDKDLETARQKAMANIKVEMLGAVAQNIEYSNESLLKNIVRGNNISSTVDVREQSKVSVANLPFITGISFSNASGSYWEKTQEKDGTQRYTFHLLYPFPQSQYQELKRQFDELDNSQVAVVKHYEQQKEAIDNVDSINIAIGRLRVAADYFFDKNRRTRTENVIGHYLQMLNSLNIVSKRIDKHQFQFWFELSGKKMRCSIMPKTKAECASNIKCSSDGQIYTVTFSDDYCVPDDDNTITLFFTFNDKKLKHELHF